MIPPRRAFLRGLASLPLIGGGVARDGGGDAELLQLGRELEAAWAHERELWAQISDASAMGENEALDEANGRTTDLIKAIEKLTATMLAGVMVKARACLYCMGDDVLDENAFCEADASTTDVRLAAGIVKDVLGLRDRLSTVEIGT